MVTVLPWRSSEKRGEPLDPFRSRCSRRGLYSGRSTKTKSPRSSKESGSATNRSNPSNRSTREESSYGFSPAHRFHPQYRSDGRVPVHVRVQELKHGIDVAAGERLIATAYELHVLLRHRLLPQFSGRAERIEHTVPVGVDRPIYAQDPSLAERVANGPPVVEPDPAALLPRRRCSGDNQGLVAPFSITSSISASQSCQAWFDVLHCAAVPVGSVVDVVRGLASGAPP